MLRALKTLYLLATCRHPSRQQITIRSMAYRPYTAGERKPVPEHDWHFCIECGRLLCGNLLTPCDLIPTGQQEEESE